MYFYHAHAIALGGRLGPHDDPIKVKRGSCALAVTGGAASASAPPFDFHGIKFQSALSQVSGSEKKVNGADVYVTRASVIIEKLNIRDVVTADRIEAYIKSEHRENDYEGSTVITGSQFVNLNIAGQTIEPTLSNVISQYPTFRSMQNAYTNSSTKATVLDSVVGCGLQQANVNSEDLQAAFDAYKQQNDLPRLKPTVVCSFVKCINKAPTGGTNWGSIINVSKLGRVYLGEVIVWPWMRCLTMFRIELDSDGGSISGGSVGTNGSGFPPGAAPPDWP